MPQAVSDHCHLANGPTVATGQSQLYHVRFLVLHGVCLLLQFEQIGTRMTYNVGDLLDYLMRATVAKGHRHEWPHRQPPLLGALQTNNASQRKEIMEENVIGYGPGISGERVGVGPCEAGLDN